MTYDPNRPVEVLEQDLVVRMSEADEIRRNVVAYRIDRIRYGPLTRVPPHERRKDLVVWMTEDGRPPKGLRPGQFGYGMKDEDCLL